MSRLAQRARLWAGLIPALTFTVLTTVAARADEPAPGPAASTVADPAALPGPLSAAWAEAFAGITPDPRPTALVRDTHYIVSNEDNHFVWRSAISGRGGVYVGVGTDQNYVLAGWVRPEFLVLLDFDQVVVDLHRVYGVIFMNAPTPHDFLDMWEDRNVRRVEELIEALKVDAPTRRGMLAAYRTAHFAVPRRLRRVESAYKPLGVRWFLNDINQYRYVAELFRTGRVVTVRGDLSIGGSMNAVATAARKAGAVVRTVYLSNAERYFPYTAGFKNSLLALPTDERSIILRTRARMSGAYEYIEQDAANFKRWLDWGKMSYAVEITRYRELQPATGAYVIRREPPAGRKANGKAATDKSDAGTPAPAAPQGSLHATQTAIRGADPATTVPATATSTVTAAPLPPVSPGPAAPLQPIIP